MLKLDTVAGQLIRLHDDLKFTNERVSAMEYLLNVHSTSPKQAKIINALPCGEDMVEGDTIVTAGIDTSESTVTMHNHDIEFLKEETITSRKTYEKMWKSSTTRLKR